MRIMTSNIAWPSSYLLAHYKNVKTIVNYYKDAKSWVFSHAAEISILLGYDATALSNCFPVPQHNTRDSSSRVHMKFTPWNMSPLHCIKTLRTVYTVVWCHIPDEWKFLLMLKMSLAGNFFGALYHYYTTVLHVETASR